MKPIVLIQAPHLVDEESEKNLKSKAKQLEAEGYLVIATTTTSRSEGSEISVKILNGGWFAQLLNYLTERRQAKMRAHFNKLMKQRDAFERRCEELEDQKSDHLALIADLQQALHARQRREPGSLGIPVFPSADLDQDPAKHEPFIPTVPGSLEAWRDLYEASTRAGNFPAQVRIAYPTKETLKIFNVEVPEGHEITELVVRRNHDNKVTEPPVPGIPSPDVVYYQHRPAQAPRKTFQEKLEEKMREKNEETRNAAPC